MLQKKVEVSQCMHNQTRLFACKVEREALAIPTRALDGSHSQSDWDHVGLLYVVMNSSYIIV